MLYSLRIKFEFDPQDGFWAYVTFKLTTHFLLQTRHSAVDFCHTTYTLSWSVSHRVNFSLSFSICIYYKQYLLFLLRVFRHMWDSHEWSINVKIISHSAGKARDEVLRMGVFHITLFSRRLGRSCKSYGMWTFVQETSICRNQWKCEKWEDQNQYGWMKLMETLGNWLYDCGGEELQVEKSGRNFYWKPSIFLSCRGDDDDDDDFVCRLLKALFAYCNFVVLSCFWGVIKGTENTLMKVLTITWC
jgi:hypothetical protein